MKYNIYLLSYNNYNNRQVKKLDSINDYNNGGYILNSVPNVNFEMADGIASKIIINSSYVNNEPDYILVEDIASRVIDLEGNLVSSDFSRWFIIDSELIRGNQYQFTLKRDIWVDHYDLCMNSTYFIERGYVQPTSDLIFNNEQQQFSQIKKSQTPLYDETECPWIVGYMPKEINKTSDTTISSVIRPDSADYVVSSLSAWDYWQYVESNPSHISLYSDNVSDAYRFVVRLPIKTTSPNGNDYKMLYMGYSASNKSTYGGDVDDIAYYTPNVFIQESGLGYATLTENQYESYKSSTQWYNLSNTSNASYIPTIQRGLFYKQPSLLTGSTYDNLIQSYKNVYNIDNSAVSYVENNLNGKTIKDTSTGKIYKITLNDRILDLDNQGDSNYIPIRTYIRQLLDLTQNNTYGTSVHYKTADNVQQIFCYITLKVLRIVLTEVGTAKTIVPKDDTSSGDTITTYRNHLVDQVFDMFAIPYGSLVVKNNNNNYTCNKDIALAIAQAFVTTLGTDIIYDLQMLPYCPVREYIQNDGTFDITGASNTKVRPVYFGNDNTLPVSFVFYCTNSQIDNMTLLHKVNNSYVPYNIQITNTKIQYNTEMYRLSSPNFASSFEFNAAQNGGVNSFIVSATYKPYNPYIRVRPNFDRMYGQDFRDGRGLILQGDFSIPNMSNAWTNYELQNKNYLNSFNREIQSMNLQNKIANENDIWQAVAGSLQGTVSGAVAGGMVGGAYGAIAGGIVGGVSSIAGGVRDVQNNRKLRNDSIDKAKTLFNYQMDNIKALPDTIRNVGSLTIDNMLVPILEFYQASDDELDTFNKKMQYYGMCVMKVGTILEYLNPNGETFIQGNLLRLLPPQGVLTEADNHLAEEISSELQKGLYI